MNEEVAQLFSKHCAPVVIKDGKVSRSSFLGTHTFHKLACFYGLHRKQNGNRTCADLYTVIDYSNEIPDNFLVNRTMV